MPQLPNITTALASQLIATQFPEYADLPIISVGIQGHDNRTYRLGNDLLIRIPTAAPYALKVPQEQALLPLLQPHLPLAIPKPIKMGQPSADFPFYFSIYKWIEGHSANTLKIDKKNLEPIALQLARFLKELQNIKSVDGPTPGQHNWWRGDHISVYDNGARQQIHGLADIIDSQQAIHLWEQACATSWHQPPVWIHGDFAAGNIILNHGKVVAIIDFGGMGVGDPACDLVIAWTLLQDKARAVFMDAMELDHETWLRAKAWALWKASFELLQIKDKNSHMAFIHRKIIDEVLA